MTSPSLPRGVNMRARKEVEKDYKPTDELLLEVLLDIRELLIKALKKAKKK